MNRRNRNPLLKSTEIRINNSNNITYVLKKYYNGTYKFTTFQKNAAANCYYQVGKAQTGTC